MAFFRSEREPWLKSFRSNQTLYALARYLDFCVVVGVCFVVNFCWISDTGRVCGFVLLKFSVVLLKNLVTRGLFGRF